MEKKAIRVVSLCFLALILLSVVAQVSALGADLVCLRKGEKLEFSRCNPDVSDYICKTTTCQLCINEISDKVYCQDYANCKEHTGNCTYIYDAPDTSSSSEIPDIGIVSLLSPGNLSLVQAGEVEFSFKVTKSSQLEKCELYINNELANSKSKPISLSTQRLKKNLETGNYDWFVECTQKSAYGGNTTVSEIRTISILAEVPEPQKVIAVLPASPYSATITDTQEIIFNYSLDSTIYRLMDTCSLVLNDVENQTESNLKLSNEFKLNLSVGAYNWQIFCKENNNNYTTEIRTLTLSAPAPPAPAPSGSSSGGGSSGGGGSRAASTVVAQPAKVINKSANMTNQTNVTNVTQENETEENVPAPEVQKKSIFSGITGAFSNAGEKLKANMLPAIIVLVAIIILIIIFWPTGEAPAEQESPDAAKVQIKTVDKKSK